MSDRTTNDPRTRRALEQAFRAAVDCHRRGDLSGAERAYGALLAQDPTHAPALHYLGLVAYQSGRAADARRWIGEAIALTPNAADMYANRALAAVAEGASEAALADYDRAIALKPDFLSAFYGRGNVHLERQDHAPALADFEQVLRLDPVHADGRNGAGNALLGAGRAAESLLEFSRAVELRPDAPLYRSNRALTYLALQRPAEALADVRKARELGLVSPISALTEGNALIDLGRPGEARAAFKVALAAEPANPRIWQGIGFAFVAESRFAEAVSAFDRALHLPAISPTFDAETRVNRATALKQLGRRQEAWSEFERVAAAAPSTPFIRGLVFHERLCHADWRDFDAARASIREAATAGEVTDSPFGFLSVSDDPSEQLQVARRFVADKGLASARGWGARPRPPAARIRIAYLSGDFHDHATSQLAVRLFERHDRARFEVTALSFGPDDGSALRARVAGAFERFVEGRHLSDTGVADTLTRLGIDIAVDLTGHAQRSRTFALARRPAPIQVAYLGFPGTLGAPWIDYLVADSIVIPLAERVHYCEALALLGNCYQPQDDLRLRPAEVPSRASLGLPDNAIVYASLGATYKLNPPLMDAWVVILAAMPDAVLWLLDGEEGVADRLRSELQRRGIAPERVIFAPFAARQSYLARLAQADLFLDTYPYGAHTTGSDALFMGVPLLTVPGRSFASRVGASLVAAVGLPELIAESSADYVSRAIDYGRNPVKLQELRRRLEMTRTSAALWDGDRIRRDLEAAYEAMWARHQAGLPPVTFEVGERVAP